MRPVRKLLRKSGFDFHRAAPEIDRIAWLREADIRSVIDVGANVGQFASEIRRVLPRAHIYSFEPMKECFDTLASSRKNDLLFTAYNIGLGDVGGEAMIHKNAYAPSSSLLPNSSLLEKAFPFTKDSTDEKIVLKTLDSVLSPDSLEKNILLKLDVQGYEEKALKGARALLAHASIVFVETSFYELYEGQPLFADLYRFLDERGFEYRGNVQEKRDPKTGKVLFEDSVFIRKGSPL